MLFQVKRNRPCLEPCLKDFMSAFDKLSLSAPMTTSVYDYSCLYGGFHDAGVPFPRTSGARFNSADKLVVFGRPSHLKQMATDHTPRALSDLSAYLQTLCRPQVVY